VTVYWIASAGLRLGTMARPRGGEWLNDELRGLAAQGVITLVSCLEPHEELELNLLREAEMWRTHGRFVAFPVGDRQTPQSSTEAMALAAALTQAAQSGALVAHCRMGVGRATMVAALVLLEVGKTVDEALELIAEARGRPVPDTPRQVEWLRSYAARRDLERLIADATPIEPGIRSA